MNIPNLRDLDAALRLRFDIFLMMVFLTLNPGKPYFDNWHIDAMVFRANEILRGNVRRLIVNVPPRNLKTITFNIALSAFMLGHDPHLRIFTVSYKARDFEIRPCLNCAISAGFARERGPASRLI